MDEQEKIQASLLNFTSWKNTGINKLFVSISETINLW